MVKTEDYYRILQVHYFAEPEVIEGAYRKLAKKYHPDINKNESAKEIMQMINKAYAVLSNPTQRERYNMEWRELYFKSGHEDPQIRAMAEKLKKTLLTAETKLYNYFQHIMMGRFDEAYQLISNFDKANIDRKDFIAWQKAVAIIFRLKEHELKVKEIHKNKLLNGHLFDEVVEFKIDVLEYNAVMDMTGRDVLAKMVVFEEDGEWRVFVGHEKLQPFIEKVKELSGLLNAKAVLNELSEDHSKLDGLTGLLNPRGIKEKLKAEVQRNERYGNIFSTIFCVLDFTKTLEKTPPRVEQEQIIKAVGNLLLNNLRKLDSAARWEENAFLVLLPETELNSALAVSEKVDFLIKKEPTYLAEKFIFGLGAAEYADSLDKTLNRALNRVIMK
ncbi:MAG: DnaJ domain-containing protein [Bacillota bacterium]